MLMDVFPALWTMRITELLPRGLACDVVVLAAEDPGARSWHQPDGVSTALQSGKSALGA